MKCPVCKEVDLLMSERQGVEIDYCPNCRGVWLDRNELDKIIEMSVVNTKGYDNDKNYNSNHIQHKYDDDYKYHKKHKKKSMLSEMFDIF